MKGIFVNQNGCVKYAEAIVKGYKPIETRGKNMLNDCVGGRVAIIRTVRNKKPMIIGYVDIVKAVLHDGTWMSEHRNLTLIPEGSKYDCNGRAKWCYYLENPEECEPYLLPDNAIRHGRSWAEF